jgi:glutamate synthase domain-containing protein 1/glutamate synthase domain-containing protein 3
MAENETHWLLDEKFGARVVKDGCGVFGILRKEESPKISSVSAVQGISCVKYRGSHLGAGYASFNLAQSKANAAHNVMAFVENEAVAKEIEGELLKISSLESNAIRSSNSATRMKVWEGLLYRKENVSERTLEEMVDQINSSLISNTHIKGRIFSYGRYVRVYKEVGYPSEVAEIYGLDTPREEADMWISHTRQPTNSPGTLPVWSHPFASMDCAIVHNGDISSFGANVELLKSWGFTSHIGTDSEVIARLLDRLLREEKIGIREAATILTNPFEESASKETLEIMSKYRGARLDGPFAVVAGYCDGNDCYLIALSDRSKFRPLVLGEDENCFYVASEESQIRLLSGKAKIWTPEPGSFFIASQKRGLIESGTKRNAGLQEAVLRTARSRSTRQNTPTSLKTISATGMDFREINSSISQAYQAGKAGINFVGLYGQRYLGIGFSSKARVSPSPFRIELDGFPGNCLANLNDGGIFEIFGNVADDVADTMHSGSIIIHGSARDVLGQALQGGSILVRGSVGNRAAIQMREYRDNRPFLIVGETADDYLGEYMAGGITCILNLSDSQNAVGHYVGTGMVGGRIYIRGNMSDSQIGLLPRKEDVLRYLKVAMEDGRITKEIYSEASGADFPSLRLLKSILPSDLFERVKFLFFSNKYCKSLSIARRTLTDSDIDLLSDKLHEFFRAFSIPKARIKNVMASEFTVIQAGEAEILKPLPPQEIPVEE